MRWQSSMPSSPSVISSSAGRSSVSSRSATRIRLASAKGIGVPGLVGQLASSKASLRLGVIRERPVEIQLMDGFGIQAQPDAARCGRAA